MFIAYRMYVKTCNFANTPLLLSEKLCLYTPSIRVNSNRHFDLSGRAYSTARIFRKNGFTVTCFRCRSTVSWWNKTGGIGQGSSRTEWSQCSSCPGNISFATIPWLHMFLAIKQSSHWPRSRARQHDRKCRRNSARLIQRGGLSHVIDEWSDID